MTSVSVLVNCAPHPYQGIMSCCEAMSLDKGNYIYASDNCTARKGVRGSTSPVALYLYLEPDTDLQYVDSSFWQQARSNVCCCSATLRVMMSFLSKWSAHR